MEYRHESGIMLIDNITNGRLNIPHGIDELDYDVFEQYGKAFAVIYELGDGDALKGAKKLRSAIIWGTNILEKYNRSYRLKKEFEILGEAIAEFPQAFMDGAI